MRELSVLDSPRVIESGVALGPLLDLSRALNKSADLPTLLDSILLTVMGDLLADSAMILTTRDGSLFSAESAQGLPQGFVGRSLFIGEFPRRPTRIEDLRDADLRLFMEANNMAVAAPIHHDGENLAMIGLGRRFEGAIYSNPDLAYLEALTNLIATSILSALAVEALEAQSRKLSIRLRELDTLLELSRDFHTLKSCEEIAHLLLLRAMGEAAAVGCLVFLGDRARLELTVSKGFLDWDPVSAITSPDFLGALERLRDPVCVDEFVGCNGDVGLLPRDADLLVPMHNQDELRGLLVLSAPVNGEHAPEKISFLSTLGSLSMAVQENARLFHEELEKKRIENELNVAAVVQAQLLPRGEPRVPHYSVRAKMLTSLQVGGDYYDCIEIDSTHYAVCVADVSGKGVPAALLMANIQASLRALVTVESDIGRLANRINQLIGDNTDTGQFVTCFLGILDTEAHVLHYVNAGHDHPRVFSADGSLCTLETGGVILGIIPDFQYETRTHEFRPGDLLVMYSDGVTEAHDERDEMFGESRVDSFVGARRDQPVDVIFDGLIAEVERFCGDAPQSDDITLYMLRRET